MPGLNTLATVPVAGDRTYADMIHFVHVYTIEAHPMAPDPSPYAGAVWEMDFSTVDQPKDYPHRVAHTRAMKEFLEGDQLLLVDSLDPDSLINPVWCTYGPSPNAAYLIGQDGMIVYAAHWTNAALIEPELRKLLTQ